MPRLSLAIPGLGPLPAGDIGRRSTTLGRWLARGEPTACDASSWRHWLLREAGFEVPVELPAAAVLEGGTGALAVASPAHLWVGLEHVHLDPAGLPALDAAEWQELACAFNASFGEEGVTLRPCDGHGIVSLPAPVEAVTHDPQPLAGRDAGAWLPSGPDGGRLRRLMTGIEMWLHDHPFNRHREAAGRVPVNALWLWGTGTAPVAAMDTTRPLPRLMTNDAFLRRLWVGAGAHVLEPSSRFESRICAGTERAMVALALDSLGPEPVTALERLETAWLAPIETALAAGSLQSLSLWLDGTVVELSRRSRWRFWQRGAAAQAAHR